jgi:hypothetical protein
MFVSLCWTYSCAHISFKIENQHVIQKSDKLYASFIKVFSHERNIKSVLVLREDSLVLNDTLAK